ncbi:MAG: benzoate/H(+) symporter BenE family transporter [Rhodocyclaceae bacterium]|nr:benzoate/H(+) symporter BenE family transporter [Rhodocyclaceae bacterium]
MRAFSASHIAAGFIAVLVGYTSSAAIVFQAASAAGASPAQLGSWMWALGLGMGLTCIGLSLRFRTPVLTAWSTPGAALLATALAGHSMGEAVAAFLVSSLLITLTGRFGWTDRILRHVPPSLAGAMLAGILLPFCLGLFKSIAAAPALVVTMLAIYLLARRRLPRTVVPLTLAVGLAISLGQGTIRGDSIGLDLAQPLWMAPSFSFSAVFGVGLPLYIVTMASQNLPGLAVLRANGYSTPSSPLLTWTGATGLALAPFGGFAFNLAAITAAICMSPNADPDPARRYLASVWAGVFYLVSGLFGATAASLLGALPQPLVVSIAGLALLGTVGSSLADSLRGERERLAALLCFLTTASGVSLFGIGSALWGLLLGLAALHLERRVEAA